MTDTDTEEKTIAPNIPTEVATEIVHHHQNGVDRAVAVAITMIHPTTAAIIIPARTATVAVGDTRERTNTGEVTDIGGGQHILHHLVRWVFLCCMSLEE